MAEVKKVQNKQQQKTSEKEATVKTKNGMFKETFALDKTNYLLMAIGLFFLVLGFILMAAKGHIYSFRKLHLFVIFIMFGFLFEIYAIMKKPKE